MNNADKLGEYAEKNPIMIYGDPEDELPEGVIEAIISGDTEKVQEAMWEIEISAYESYKYNSYALRDACTVLDINYENLTEEEKDAFMESVSMDYSDFWRVCFNNSRPHIAVTLLDDNGDSIDGPHECNGQENQRISDFLMEKFGDSGENAELVYYSEVLKIGGTFDLKTLLENGPPDFIEIGPDDASNLLFHSSWYGSGSLGSFKPTKTTKVKCKLTYDTNHNYGLDAVYGFTRDYWDHELNFKWSEEK